MGRIKQKVLGIRLERFVPEINGDEGFFFFSRNNATELPSTDAYFLRTRQLRQWGPGTAAFPRARENIPSRWFVPRHPSFSEFVANEADAF